MRRTIISDDFTLYSRDDPLAVQIHLASDYVDDRLFWDSLAKLFEPRSYVFKALAVADIIDQDADVCSSVVDWRHGSETLLPRGIPNLQFDPYSILNEFAGVQRRADSGGCGRG